MELINVSCGIIVRDEMILAAQRSSMMHLPLKWEFPGGKVKVGESDEDCLHRELKEELNIYIKIEKRLDTVIHDYENFTIRLIPFVSLFLHGEINLLEHKRIKWISKDKLSILDWATADLAIVKQLKAIDLP